MVFSSHLFCFYFLPIALALYYASPRRVKHFVMTVLSYAFYGWTNPAFMVLMLFSTAVDYVCGRILVGWRRQDLEPLPTDGARTRRQKIALWVSILSNLSLLSFFKYFNFAVDNYNAFLQSLGLENLQADGILRVALPLGISFYTFQSMSYTIDVYRGRSAALRNPIDFACYVSMFPQLVAGPIIRFSEISEQLRERTHTTEKFARGVAMFCLGMAKKVLLANPCGKIADLCFDANALNVLDAWYGVIAYALQIYFDFSGYSDMAIGLGLMFGFVFPKNFDSPYRSRSITEFWRRWHLSLSRWLRDYLYIPLGGNRRGTARTYVNLMLVMLLGGLWHGAAWNFVIWGGLHGALLAIERARGGERAWTFLSSPIRQTLIFVFVLITWIFFRAPDLPSAMAYLGALLPFGETSVNAILLGDLIARPYYIATWLVALFVAFVMPQSWDFTRRLDVYKAVLCIALFWLALIAIETQGYNPFIYFLF